MKPALYKTTATIHQKTITFETGQLAFQAGGAVTATIGGTMVFGTATMASLSKEESDFFPLTVDYEERMYAGGRIPGSFFRREGRPSTEAILIARLCDRPIRPLFPKDFFNEVQVLLYSFSVDDENPLDILAVNAASAALMISDIPWGGPVGAVRVGLIDGQLVINPTYKEMKQSALDLRMAGTRDAILMVECGADQVKEVTIVEALEFGHQALQGLIDAQEELAQLAGKPKRTYVPYQVSEELIKRVEDKVSMKIEEILANPQPKASTNEAIQTLEDQLCEEWLNEGAEEGLTKRDITNAFAEVYKKVVRSRIIEKGIRPDGRGLKDIRPIWCDVNYSPRAHGSGLFTRGETQVLTLATLGTPREAQELDGLAPQEVKRYIHHYNFTPFSTGEVYPVGRTPRRSIGHGALAERALVPVIPPESEFPYTMRLVSEVLSSNGSTSMASVCASTLALMDTGVPIKAPVAGIAMGLIMEGNRYAILTDIQGVEDHLGDMDFKVAGTVHGITALQMDIKVKGLSKEIMSQALEQAREARFLILDEMLKVMPEPRPELKPFVPRIFTVKIPVDKIGSVIGPGGKNIRAIQEESGATLDISEDGTVYIATSNKEGEMIARERLAAYTETVRVGQIYTGKVVRTTSFGAFVEILPKQDGMVHISQLDSERVRTVEDVVRVGDEITVMVTGIEADGKIRLSRQAVLEGWTAEEAIQRDKPMSKGKDYQSHQKEKPNHRPANFQKK